MLLSHVFFYLESILSVEFSFLSSDFDNLSDVPKKPFQQKNKSTHFFSLKWKSLSASFVTRFKRVNRLSNVTDFFCLFGRLDWETRVVYDVTSL